MFQVASFTARTYIAAGAIGTCQPCRVEWVEPRRGLDPRTPLNVRIAMKSQNDLSLWSIIERLQRRLERQGMTPATADRALSIALRQIAATR
jgi:hypothetical protein